MKYTQRGFALIKFRDSNGYYCSLQESSAARFEEDDGSISDGKIWLGADKSRDGVGLGETVKDHNGQDVKLGARMHLTQSQVRELLPYLEYFAEYGELPKEANDDS